MVEDPNKRKFTFKQARLNRGLSQEAIAQRLEITKSTYVAWENGKVNIKAFHLFAVAGVLSMNPDELII